MRFDPVKAADYLTQNQRLSEMAKDYLKVKLEVSGTEFITLAPGPFYGLSNRTCMITTHEQVSYVSPSRISKRLVSRTCSTECSTS